VKEPFSVRKETPFCHVGVVFALFTILISGVGTWASEPGSVLEPDLGAAPPSGSDMPAFCFALGTPADTMKTALEDVARYYERHSLSSDSLRKMQVEARWSYTATDGPVSSQGTPITLTWSIVPDGTPIGSGYGEPANPSDLHSYLDGIYGDINTWLPIFQQMFDRWSQLTGVTYVYEPHDDGFTLTTAAGLLGVRADIRIGGHFIDGNSNVLAYNYYPNTGDMVIDTGDSYFTNTWSNSLRLRNTLAHEHGHGLGFAHSCPVNQTKLMEPMISQSFDGPQHDDILAAHRNYGDRYENDDTPGTAASLGSFGSTSKSNLSVDGNSDTDVYSFIVDAGAAADLTVSPIGMTYLSGPQNGTTCSAGTSYNSLTIQDLEVRVIDKNGVNELASADANGVGQPETLTNVDLSSGAGTYYIEVTGDSSDATQLYEFSMTISSTDRVFSEGFESGDLSTWSSRAPQ